MAVLDQFGNVVTTDNSQITLSIDGGGPVILNGQVTTTVQNGIATFDRASINQIGNYKLDANDGIFAPVVSNQFNISAPATIYVDQNATGAANGQDWVDAYTSVQTALSNAIPGDTIDVAQGDYSPGDTATSTFQLADGVTLQGGFKTGGAAVPNPSMYPTVLDGTDSAYHVVTGSGTNYTAVLQGFTIQGGNASGDGTNADDSYFGGGLLIDGGSPTISDCTFTANSAVSGGAIYIANQGRTSRPCRTALHQQYCHRLRRLDLHRQRLPHPAGRSVPHQLRPLCRGNLQLQQQ